MDKEERESADYGKAVEYLFSIPRFIVKNTPPVTQAFYRFLGSPGEDVMIFHVAGTNGKGSVCSYIASMAEWGGYRTGMFTSPHLLTPRERFRIGGELISEKEFTEVFEEVKGKLAQFKESGNHPSYHPSFFEYLFFMAVLWFEKKEAEIIVLETGLGGRLDATNVIEHPAVCVITSVGMDHQEHLGSSLAEIAGEKAGIIKAGRPVVYSNIRQEVSAIVEEKAREKGCFCRGVGRVNREELCFADKHIDFSLLTRYYGTIRCCLHTVAHYQPDNAALAVAAIEESGLRLTADRIREGLGRCRWEARMEEILPGVFLDGAHNEDGIEALLETARRDGSSRRILLFSVVADKDYRGMKERLVSSDVFHEIYAVPLKNARGLRRQQLRELFGDSISYVFPDSREAFGAILAGKGETDCVYIAGSLYLAGEIKALLNQRESFSEQ
ncbi:MAG: bifunctional folylpolyglutamate synthase/dihydrofolate synthase [Lachnospiraceae bacterium]|nr:bifunctional folylpolyglutamate synthase/dihydrofolate synthase [Lachnospiraceae bacterium]